MKGYLFYKDGGYIEISVSRRKPLNVITAVDRMAEHGQAPRPPMAGDAVGIEDGNYAEYWEVRRGGGLVSTASGPAASGMIGAGLDEPDMKQIGGGYGEFGAF